MMNPYLASMISTGDLRALERKLSKPATFTQGLILRGIQAELKERDEEPRILKLEDDLETAQKAAREQAKTAAELHRDKQTMREAIEELKSQLSDAGESNAEKIVESVLG